MTAAPLPESSRRTDRLRTGPAAGSLGRTAVPALLGPAIVLPLAAANGGYFATAWGWSALALLWLAVLALALGGQGLAGRLEAGLLAAVAALAGWTLLSSVWTSTSTQTVLEGQRALVYLAGVLATLLLVRRASYGALLGGVWGAVTVAAAYGLLTRLFPERLGTYDPIAGYRLSEPVGYWNALGVFAAMGSLLALGLAARSRTAALRALAAASLPVLVLTLYFTFSRGAWLALGFGLLAMVALDRRRLQLGAALLAVAPWPALAVWLASRSEALTRQSSTLAAASSDGHRLAAILGALALAGAVAALVLVALETRIRPARAVRLAAAVALSSLLVGGATAVFVAYGSPPTLVRKAYDGFNAPPPETGTDLNRRLFSFSGSGRAVQWKVAWRDYKAHPWLGSGAGSYEQYWLQHRPIAGKIRDAHSLYLEQLAELGPVGLGLLATALGIPLVAAVRARRRRLVPAAFGAYVAYLTHAGVDWDWEMTAVTLAALFCGAACVLPARRDEETRPLSLHVRLGALAAILALSAVAFVGLVGNSALAKSRSALLSQRWLAAEAQARKAIRWAPWSAEAWERLGETQVALYDVDGARASFRKAIEKDPRNWLLWYELAGVSRGAERRQAALRVVRLNPLSAEAAEMRRAARL